MAIQGNNYKERKREYVCICKRRIGGEGEERKREGEVKEGGEERRVLLVNKGHYTCTIVIPIILWVTR